MCSVKEYLLAVNFFVAIRPRNGSYQPRTICWQLLLCKVFFSRKAL